MPVANPLSAALLQQMSIAGLSPMPSSGLLDTVRTVLEGLLQQRMMERQAMVDLINLVAGLDEKADIARALEVLGPLFLGKRWSKYKGIIDAFLAAINMERMLTERAPTPQEQQQVGTVVPIMEYAPVGKAKLPVPTGSSTFAFLPAITSGVGEAEPLIAQPSFPAVTIPTGGLAPERIETLGDISLPLEETPLITPPFVPGSVRLPSPLRPFLGNTILGAIVEWATQMGR